MPSRIAYGLGIAVAISAAVFLWKSNTPETQASSSGAAETLRTEKPVIPSPAKDTQANAKVSASPPNTAGPNAKSALSTGLPPPDAQRLDAIKFDDWRASRQNLHKLMQGVNYAQLVNDTLTNENASITQKEIALKALLYCGTTEIMASQAAAARTTKPSEAQTIAHQKILAGCGPFFSPEGLQRGLQLSSELAQTNAPSGHATGLGGLEKHGLGKTAVDEARQLLESGNPMHFEQVAQFLESQYKRTGIARDFNSAGMDVTAMVSGASWAFCETTGGCGENSAELLSLCAYFGRCGLQNMGEYLRKYEAENIAAISAWRDLFLLAARGQDLSSFRLYELLQKSNGLG